jgi:hypothetical protein
VRVKVGIEFKDTTGEARTLLKPFTLLPERREGFSKQPSFIFTLVYWDLRRATAGLWSLQDSLPAQNLINNPLLKISQER